MFSVGDIVTYKNRDDENPPHGRLVQELSDASGERMWLVAWAKQDGQDQRLRIPERSLRPLTREKR